MKINMSGYKINIEDVEAVDSLSVNIADSFVKYNKFLNSGAGESKLYCGSLNKRPKEFFGDDFINKKNSLSIIPLKYALKTYIVENFPDFTQVVICS